MKSLLQFRSLILFVLLSLFLLPNKIISQDKNFVGKKLLKSDDKVSLQTIPKENTSGMESLDDHLNGLRPTNIGDQYVQGGSVLWWTDDQGTAAIANTVAINGLGDRVLTGWGLNQMRVSHYTDVSNIPLWEFPTLPYDAHVDISDNNQFIAIAAGPNFFIYDTTGAQIFNSALPDSFYASVAGFSRDGSMAIILANSFGNSNTARVIAVALPGTTAWTIDVPVTEIASWTGVNFSADGSKVVINGRNHIYVFNASDGSLIWDRFLDNTEAPAVISGDGNILATADNSGFLQTWIYDEANSEYDLLWQYRIPGGQFTNWASSVDVSADGSTIIAGTLIFLSAGYEGSVIAFDTYGGGTPKWIFSGAGDLVDDIAISDDGKVAAAVTWGDLAHTRPDLFVFDVVTGEITFEVITPGSFFTCDISNDGRRVIAGGKAVHAREFGNGGRIYLSEIDLGGGNVSGNVDLLDTDDDSGVVVKAVGNQRSAVTDANGNYLIQNIPAGTYTIQAEKPGYNFGQVTDVVVVEGNTTENVNFLVVPYPFVPPGLGASTDLVGAILLSWESLFKNPEREREIARMVGDDISKVDLSGINTKSVVESNSLNNKSFSDLIPFGVDSAAVYRSIVSGGPYSRIASVPILQTSYVDSNVFALRDYYYVINLFDESGQSIYSNEALGRVSDSLLTFSFDVPQASVPTIDGILSPGEWDDAFKLDISDIFGYGSGSPKPQGSVFMYLKFDDNNDMLYVGGEDFLNPTLNDNEGFGLYIDDNNNNVFNGTPPFIQEGNFWAYWHPGGADLRFRDLNTFAVDTLVGAEVVFTDGSGHLQGEVAIPMGFLQGYHLQVFGPEKTPGVGAFIIGKQPDQSTIFNGWWPQTMNSLFNPMYFGDVGIDVTLTAPPQAPSNIIVTRQVNDLVINWTDPSLGLNNEPLPVPPTINIYKNGELLTTVSGGVQVFRDEDVYCPGWYEYQLEASIEIGPGLLTGPISAPVGNFACKDVALTPISYDDGEWDSFYAASFSWEHNKFAVRFTPPTYPAYVRRMETTANSNDDFDFTIQSDSGGIPGDTIAGPYRVYGLNPPGIVSIVTKTVPGIDPPEIREGDFWVVINWLEETPGSPGIGVDFDPPGADRSFYYLDSQGWVSLVGGNILLTAYLSDVAVDVEGETGSELPLTFDLKQNYPNPFNPSTIISYQLPESETVSLEIFNSLGEKVRTLINNIQEAGYYNIEWDGKNNSGNLVSSGMYLYRINAGTFVKVHKMMLLR